MHRTLLILATFAAALLLAGRVKAQWTDLGGGLPGTGGVAPALVGLGPQIPTAGTKLTVTGGQPSHTVFLIVGLSALGAPFKGGTLFPDPNILLTFAFDGAGNWQLVFSWPDGIPFLTQLWWQVWTPDAGGPKGFASTNGLKSVAS
jgi:hypothetical protein